MAGDPLPRMKSRMSWAWELGVGGRISLADRYVQPQRTGESEASAYRPSARRRMPVFAGTSENLALVLSDSDGPLASKATFVSFTLLSRASCWFGSKRPKIWG